MSTLREEREAIVDMIDDIMAKYHMGEHMYSPEREEIVATILSHEEKVMERVKMSVGGINFRRQIKGAFEDYAHAHPEVPQFSSDVRRGIEKRLHANIRTLVLSKLTK